MMFKNIKKNVRIVLFSVFAILISVSIIELYALQQEKLVSEPVLNNFKSVLPIVIITSVCVVGAGLALREHFFPVGLEEAIKKGKGYRRSYDIIDDECQRGRPFAQLVLWPGLLLYQYQADKYDKIAEILKEESKK